MPRELRMQHLRNVLRSLERYADHGYTIRFVSNRDEDDRLTVSFTLDDYQAFDRLLGEALLANMPPRDGHGARSRLSPPRR